MLTQTGGPEQTGRPGLWTDGRPGGSKDRQTDTYRQTHIYRPRQTDKQTDRQTYLQRKVAGWMWGGWTDTETDRH